MTDSSWQIIPDEILINIFEYLHSIDYVRIAHVSSHWRKLAKLSYCHSVWNLQQYHKDLSRTTPSLCQPKLNNDVLWLFSKVYLSIDPNNVKFINEFIKNLLTSKKLKHLIVENPSFLESSNIFKQFDNGATSCESLTALEIVSSYAMIDCMDKFPNLKVLKFRNCYGVIGISLMKHIHQRLESCAIENSYFDSKTFFNAIENGVSNLKKISLEFIKKEDLTALSLSSFPYLRKLKISKINLQIAHLLWNSFSHQLKKFNITLADDEYQVFDFQKRNAPHLKSLQLCNSTLDECDIEIPQLEHLEIYYVYELPVIISKFVGLKTLIIRNCYEMDFSNIGQLLQLRHLEASNVGDLEAVRHISKLENIIHLTISGINDAGSEIISNGNLRNLKCLEIDFENPEKSAYYLSHSNLTNLRIIRFTLNEEASKIFSRTSLELRTVILNEICEVSHLIKNLRCDQIVVWTLKRLPNLDQNSKLAMKCNKRLIFTNDYKPFL